MKMIRALFLFLLNAIAFHALAWMPVKLMMPVHMKLWSLALPAIYDRYIEIKGKTVDHVRSYVAMRRVSTARGADGIVRSELNNKQIFHFGPLNQGGWPDGLYSASAYESIIYVIGKTKDLGFNMIREYVKVGPDFWYTFWNSMKIGCG